MVECSPSWPLPHARRRGTCYQDGPRGVRHGGQDPGDRAPAGRLCPGLTEHLQRLAGGGGKGAGRGPTALVASLRKRGAESPLTATTKHFSISSQREPCLPGPNGRPFCNCRPFWPLLTICGCLWPLFLTAHSWPFVGHFWGFCPSLAAVDHFFFAVFGYCFCNFFCRS